MARLNYSRSAGAPIHTRGRVGAPILHVRETGPGTPRMVDKTRDRFPKSPAEGTVAAAKLDVAIAMEMRRECIKWDAATINESALAEKYGISVSQVRSIMSSKAYAAVCLGKKPPVGWKP